MIKSMRTIFKLIAAVGFMVAIHGESIYVAQNQQGNGDGSSPANAHSASWFNTAGNWGAGAGKISPGGTQDTASAFVVGAGLTSNYFLNGDLDLVRLWKRKLSGAELTSSYNAGAGLNVP